MQTNKNNSVLEKYPFLQQLLINHNSPITISIVGGGGKTHLAFWLADVFKQWEHSVCVTTTTKMYLPDEALVDNIIELDSYDSKGTGTLNIDRLPRQLASKKCDQPIPEITFLYKNRLPNNQHDPETKVQGLQLEDLDTIQNSQLFSVYIVEADGAKKKPIKAPAGHEPCIPPYSDVVIGVTGAEAIFSNADPKNIHRWSQFSAVTQCLPEMEIGHAVLKRLIESPQGMFKNSPDNAVKIWVINKYDLSPNPEVLTQLAKKWLTEQSTLDSIWLTQLNRVKPIHRAFVSS